MHCGSPWPGVLCQVPTPLFLRSKSRLRHRAPLRADLPSRVVQVLEHRGSSLFQLADSHVLEVVCVQHNIEAAVSGRVDVDAFPVLVSISTSPSRSPGGIWSASGLE